VPLRGVHVAVDFQRDARVFVAQPIGYFYGRAMVGNQKAGVRVTKIMESDLFHAGLFCAFMELPEKCAAGCILAGNVDSGACRCVHWYNRCVRKGKEKSACQHNRP